MQLVLESVSEFDEMATAMGYVKSDKVSYPAPASAPASAPAPKVTKKAVPAKKAEKPVEKPAVKVAEKPVEKVAEKAPLEETATKATTPADVLAYIEANCSDDVTKIMDMLQRVGSKRISLIPADLCDKALSIIKGE